MEDIFDENGHIVVNDPELPEVQEKKTKKASTIKPIEVAVNQAALLNAKLNALLKAQGINPTTIERQVLNEATK